MKISKMSLVEWSYSRGKEKVIKGINMVVRCQYNNGESKRHIIYTSINEFENPELVKDPLMADLTVKEYVENYNNFKKISL